MIVLTVTVRGYNSLVIIIPILTLHISVPCQYHVLMNLIEQNYRDNRDNVLLHYRDIGILIIAQP